MIQHLSELSSTINYYLIEEELKNFKEWLLWDKGVELRDDHEQHINELIEKEIIHEAEHIYLTIRESEIYINELQRKINI